MEACEHVGHEGYFWYLMGRGMMSRVKCLASVALVGLRHVRHLLGDLTKWAMNPS